MGKRSEAEAGRKDGREANPPPAEGILWVAVGGSCKVGTTLSVPDCATLYSKGELRDRRWELHRCLTYYFSPTAPETSLLCLFLQLR